MMWVKSSFTALTVVAISFFIIGTTPAHADLGDQLAKLLANDASFGDKFGKVVAISGTTAVIGAAGNQDNGLGSGSAYLFDTNTGQQIAKLLPNDGVEFDNFGQSVAISGDLAIIGAVGDDDNGNGSGSAYLFEVSTGKQLFKLLADDGEALDRLGQAVAICGDIAIVGAYQDDDNGSGSGSAYLFDATTGQQIVKLLPEDGSTSDQFGWSVAISGSIAIIGAWASDDNGNSSGSAYLFDITTGQQIAKIVPNDGATGDLFGRSVAIYGITAIVGAPQDDDNGGNSGSAYLFDLTFPYLPLHIAKFVANDGATLDYFGRNVAISGTTAIISAGVAPPQSTFSGAAYIFDISIPANPMQISKLLTKDGSEDDGFGVSVAISGVTAIVGAEFDDENGQYSGSAYLFDANKCLWDMQGDGLVGVSDLLILLGWWGLDPEGFPDFNGDGIVNTNDLLQLLANWGPCLL